MDEDESKILDYPDQKDPGNRKSPYDHFLQSVMLLSFAVFIIGWLFNIQHWRFALPILLLSLVTLTLSGILRHLLRRNKTVEDYLQMIVYTILPVAFLFNLMHWEGSRVLLIAGGIAFLIYLTIRLSRSFRR